MTAVPQRAVNAAHALIMRLQARPQMHSVRVETTVDGTGEFVHSLVCSIHPKAPAAVRARVPDEVDGFTVRSEPWPRSLI